MGESLSPFACEMAEAKRRVLIERDSKKLELATRKLKEMKAMNAEEVQGLIEKGRGKIRAAVADGKNEAMILAFCDKDVMRPSDHPSWCVPKPEWIRVNFLWVFRAFEREGFKPRIENQIEETTNLQGYAIWVSIP